MIRNRNLLAFLLFAACCWPSVAGASDKQKKAAARELLGNLRADPDSLDSEVNVISIFELWDSLGAETTMSLLKRASLVPSASTRVKERTSHLLAHGLRRLGKVEEAQKRFQDRGFISHWMTVGPFDNEGGTGYSTEFPPETMATAPVTSDTPMPGKSLDVHWKQAPPEIYSMGYTDLAPVYAPAVNICSYAMSTLPVKRGGKGYLRIGAGGAVRVYWNGTQVLADPAYMESDPDRLVARVQVRPGNNRLLIKVCTESGSSLGIYARLTDGNAKPWPFSDPSNQIYMAASPVKKGAKGKKIPGPLEVLTSRAKKSNGQVKALVSAARYAKKTNSIERSTNQARDFARAACMKDDTPSNCLLWADLAIDRNRKREAITKAIDANGDSLPALVALINLELDGLNPRVAAPVIELVLSKSKHNLDAQVSKIQLYAKLGFLSTAFRKADSLLKEHPELPKIAKLAERLGEQSGHAKESLAITESLLDMRYDHRGGHETLARAAAARGEEPLVRSHLMALKKLFPGDTGALLFSSELLDGIGDSTGAEDALIARTRISSNNPETWKDLGLYLIRNSRTEEGLDALERARNISPQDTWLVDYLAYLKPNPPFEQPFLVPPETFLSTRGKAEAGEHAKHLVDQTVVQVFDSGLSSTFRQVVVELTSREAARAWRRYPIQFSPSNERVKILAARVFRKDGTIGESVVRGTIPLSEPWYRLYYDVEAEILELPPLEPGDVLELRYRIDDASYRNEFGDYFGDFVFVEGDIKKDLFRYVLIAPKKRVFYFNKLVAKGLSKTVKTEGNTTTYTFESKDVDPIGKEHSMPGLSSTSSYIHVSTYRSWEELGNWYRGLIRHQLMTDEKIRNKVMELIRGKKSIRDKVGAIYKFVVTATRYVGLEFGIHGYKPYPVSLVVSRGFGDCKDKASLLVAMLGVAGIDAEFVLIRTNDLGLIDEDPASLAVFNHAIAYVPALDMWLDGTAEHFGIDELPFGDQDASSLRLGKEDSIFSTTPTASPEKNASTAEIDILLDPKDGDVELKVKASVRGQRAALMRRNLEAVQTRDERFETELARTFPGARLGKFDISLDDSTKPVTYQYTAFAPRFARNIDGKLEIPADIGLRLTESFGRLPERKHDLVLGPAFSSERTVKVGIPTGYKVAELPSTAIIESPFGSLRLEAYESSGSVVVKRIFELPVHVVAASDYAAFLNFCKQVDEVLFGRIILEEAK